MTLRYNQFLLDEKIYDSLQVNILKSQPIRELFWHGSVRCYSRDAIQAVNGRSCIFCPDRDECRRKIKLILIVHIITGEMSAFIELDSISEKNLQRLMSTKSNRLKKMVVQMSVKEGTVVFEEVIES